MINNFVFTLIFFSVLQGAFAVPLGELVLSSHAEKLTAGDTVMETQLKEPVPKLLPADADLRRIFNQNMSSLKPGILAETLYLYKKPQPARNIEAEQIQLLNQLLSISSLAGIQYYSASRGAMRAFFETSTVIDGPKTKKPLPDPTFLVPTKEVSLFARQKDLTFGDNIYQYSFISTPNCVFFVQENVTSLTYGIIPLIGKGNLRTIMAIFNCDDSLLIYGATMAKAASVPGMGERVSNSFGNRAEALILWFTDRANMVYN